MRGRDHIGIAFAADIEGEKRLSLTPNGNIRYQPKTPYRYGTTYVIFEPPPDFIARLAALVPKPRVNLIRFTVYSRPTVSTGRW